MSYAGIITDTLAKNVLDRNGMGMKIQIPVGYQVSNKFLGQVRWGSLHMKLSSISSKIRV